MAKIYFCVFSCTRLSVITQTTQKTNNMRFLSKKTLLLSLLAVTLFSSCTAYKKLPYLKDVDDLSQADLLNSAMNYQARIKPNDILSITVNTPTNAAAKDFNLPLIPAEANDVIQSRVSSTSGGYGSLQNYIVNTEGEINFPILGKLKIGGLTRLEAEAKIYSLIYPHYLKEEPIVNVRFLNYKVAVLGEVKNPGIYTSSNGQMTLFDAIAYAGDLTIYGKRNNILLIRENENGERKIFRIDLQDKNTLLANETYYLQQNDKIYVEPNKSRGNSSQIGTLETLTLSSVSLLISIISIITR